jgi:polynucleotide 5'-hydroxyl-kinase GRC3/NOL9
VFELPEKLDVPAAWERIDFSTLRGTILVIGSADAGKSTFAKYLVRQLHGTGIPTALVDGDPGQTHLGPPGTITAVLPGEQRAQIWRSFIGATTPMRHMLPQLAGASRLVRAAEQAGAQAVIFDTCGLVEPRAGGLALKLALVDLLQPTLVFALQRAAELEGLLEPLRRSRRARLVEMKVSAAPRRRSLPARQAHRASQFARYFKGARQVQVDWSELAVLPQADLPQGAFSLGRLAALEDRQGFTRSLGIITRIELEAQQLTLLAPPVSLKGVTTLHLAELELDVETFKDRPKPF